MYIKIFLISIPFLLIMKKGFAQSEALNFSRNKTIIFSIGAVNQESGTSRVNRQRAPQFSLHYRHFRNNLHFNQISINNFWKKKSTTIDFNVKAWQLGLKYSYGAKIFRFGKNCLFYLGGTAGLEYFSEDSSPRTSQVFSRTRKQYAIPFGGFAEVQFFITERFLTYIHAPFWVFHFYLDTSEVDNPGLPERLRKQGGFNFNTKNQLGIEFGFGYRF